MKNKKKNWAWIVLVCALAASCNISLCMAEEDQPPHKAAATEGKSQKEEPAVYFETEGDFFLGYRFVSTEDSLKAAEYIYPNSYITFGLDLLSCPLPYRYHANAEFVSNHDFYTDAGFAYKDLILFRDILVGVHHNLNHFDYQFIGEPPELVYNDRDISEDNYLNFVSNLLSLRLKAPNSPFHTFIKQRHVERDGRIQQRFLLGYFGELDKISESRDIDWKSNALTFGANGHFGPVELEYTFDKAKFDPGHNYILYDNYPDASDLDRPADTYPHNVIAETESSAHAVKMHSSYTGGIVAAATVSNLYQKNNYSHTKSTTWKGAFDFSWIPDPVFGLFFRYRHRDVDKDTPDLTTLHGLTHTIDYEVRKGISYDSDLFSLSSRYKPLSRLSLYFNYDFSLLDRQDVDQWELLPSQSKVHTINLRAHAKPLDRFTIKAIYEYKNYDQPAYNTTPDKSNKLRVTANYTPNSVLNFYLEYTFSSADRDSLHYLNNDPAVLLETGERERRGDQVVANVTTQITPKTSLALGWFYHRWRVEQDLAYGKWPTGDPGDLPYFDLGVPYTDEANSFSLAFNWIPRDDFNVATDLVYTMAEGAIHYSDVVGDAPFSLSSFSRLELDETSFSLALTKKLLEDWEIGLRSYLIIYNDKTSDYLDGNVFTTTFAIKRYF